MPRFFAEPFNHFVRRAAWTSGIEDFNQTYYLTKRVLGSGGAGVRGVSESCTEGFVGIGTLGKQLLGWETALELSRDSDFM